MNYPEELRERYNEVMYDERDIIQKFLEKQYDLRYGRQRDSWHFEPAVELIANQGSHVLLHDIKLDESRFVVFYVEAFCDKNAEWECFDFAYGELSKIIEVLPNAEDLVRKNAITDLINQSNELRLDLLLAEHPLVYESSNGTVRLDGHDNCSEFNFAVLGEKYGFDFLVTLRDHIHIEHLHRTKEYKEVMERLSLLENMRLEFDSPNVVMFDIKNTDMKVDILSVQRDDTRLSMRVMCVDDEKVLTLEEKDIFKEYLYDLAKWMKMWVSKWSDIIDIYNGHDEELVRKINAAWKSDKYHNRFKDILYALLMRDYNEYEDKYCDIPKDADIDYAIDHAHEIIEGVCDDLDLETILNFIRYEED